MCRIAVCFTALVALFCENSAFGEAPKMQIIAGQPVACVNDQFLQERIAFGIGSFAMAPTEAGARFRMKCFIGLWPTRHVDKKTGAINYSGDVSIKETLSVAILAILQFEPQATIDVLSLHRDVFDDWRTDLAEAAFTWSDPGPCKLETRRLNLVKLLEMTPATPRTAETRSDLLRTLRTLRCHIED